MPLSRAEKLLRKREAERKRSAKLKEDPEKLEALKRKERAKYLKKKDKKQVKPIAELSKRERRMKRKQWRENARTYRLKKKQNEEKNEFLDHMTATSHPIPAENSNVQRHSSQSITGKRVSEKNRKIRSRSWQERELAMEKLKKKVNKYKTQCRRLNMNLAIEKAKYSDPYSPQKRVTRMMLNNQSEEISKNLLFAEAVKDQLETNYKELKTNKDKKNFRRVLSGRIVKKYRITKRLRAILRGSRLIGTSISTKKRYALETYTKIIAIEKFLESDINSTMCPGKKDYCSKNGIIKQKRYLNNTMRNLHKKFLKLHSHMTISYAFWCKNRPFNIVSRKVSARDTCACTICLNMSLLIQSLARLNVIKENDPYLVMSAFCCENKTEKCLLRDCLHCKDKTIIINQNEDQPLQGQYSKWTTQKETYFDHKTKKQKTVVKTLKRKFLCSIAAMIEEFDSNIIKYLEHRGRVRHQYKRIMEMKENLKSNEALLHMDFSENYNLKYGEEIQAFHFGGSRQQISLHTVVVYTKSDNELKKECFCTLSECLQHNASGIWAHLDPILKRIDQLYSIDTLHFVSDSPATQYRNKTMFHFLAIELRKLHPKIDKFSWNYLEAGHGKGAPDGVGGVTKRTADRLVAQGNDIASFNSLVNALSNNVEGVTCLSVTVAEIEKMSKRLEHKKIINFNGTMKVHQVKSDLTQNATARLHFYSLSSLRENDQTYHLGSLVYQTSSLSEEKSRHKAVLTTPNTSTRRKLSRKKLHFENVHSDDK